MKTTVEIPEDALARTMELTGAKTKKEAINRAIEEFNRVAGQRALAKMKGKYPDFMPSEEILKLRGDH
jgi:Arc/MetJ family transcription regulator